MKLDCGCGQLDDQIYIIGLDPCLMCRLVSHLGAAFVASVIDDIAALRIGIGVVGA